MVFEIRQVQKEAQRAQLPRTHGIGNASRICSEILHLRLMTTQYTLRLHSDKAFADYRLKYKDGRFLSLEHLKGKMNQQQHEKLFMLCPQLEAAILLLELDFKGRVSWEKLTTESKSLDSALLAEYMSWYETKFGFKPKFAGSEGNALKQIITYLQQLPSTDEEVRNIWNVILTNWNLQTEFYQSQTELRQINSNLNTILKTLKNGQPTDQPRKQANDDADDFRKKFEN